eukprot:TRINITY_DN9596_c0_g2_i1.p3 TRINITY_DN9596_c0_g2~~TRINITY_DN9596_c0_g2_i1.p3  ORF type:complete len:124 (+),score=36.51 TRINITY_DN9596_c0_g2_i1:58-429(+)
MMKFIALVFILVFPAFSQRVFKAMWNASSSEGTVKVNETFQISLRADPTTGYRWELKSKPVLCELKSKSVFGEYSKCKVSHTHGQQLFTLVAKAVGEEHFKFVHERVWDTSDAREFEMIVTIE